MQPVAEHCDYAREFYDVLTDVTLWHFNGCNKKIRWRARLLVASNYFLNEEPGIMMISLLCVFLAMCCAHGEKTNNRSLLDISALLQNFQVEHLKTINISPKAPFRV